MNRVLLSGHQSASQHWIFLVICKVSQAVILCTITDWAISTDTDLHGDVTLAKI